MPQDDSENVDKFKVFVVLMQFPRAFVIGSNTVKAKKRKLGIALFEEYVAAFCFKKSRMTPIESKNQKS